MKFVRTHRPVVACLLAALVLLGAMVCSLGHGRMLAMLQPVPATEICGDGAVLAASTQTAASAGHHLRHDAHGLLMQLALFDCAFASKLSNALITFIAVGWLLRVGSGRLVVPERRDWPPSRHTSPGRVAQAP
ncbi:DUF2946 family protein [Pseudomonas sp. 3A(2025)]